jgi:hypothetical protein
MYLQGAEVTSELQVIDSSNTYFLMEPVLLKSSTGKVYCNEFFERYFLIFREQNLYTF